MTMDLSPCELMLLDRWQRGFPIVARPFAEIAHELRLAERDVIAMLGALKQRGVLSRLGATMRPNTAGASVLAAMRVAPGRIDEVAEIVNAEPGVNHNYEREHAFNLWFVATGAGRAEVDCSLANIRRATGLDVLELPLVRSFHIDLGFPLKGDSAPRTRSAARPVMPRALAPLEDGQRRILAALEDGLSFETHPFAALAVKAGTTESSALQMIRDLLAAGIITRFGLIVRHRELGFRANAMAVWDVPDADVARIGEMFAAEPFVTLCYERPRRGPEWSYNLFCMVHGREREKVAAQVASLTSLGGLTARPGAVLFSGRCFRQRGATLRAA